MPKSTTPTLMTALGFSPAEDKLYHSVLGQSGRELVSVAEALFSTVEELSHNLQSLVDAGVVRIEDARVFVLSPADAVTQVLGQTAEYAAAAKERLDSVAAAIPFLTGSHAKPAPGQTQDVEPIDGEVSSGGNPVGLLTSLLLESRGDVLWLRPDQFRRPREDSMAMLIEKVVASGRRSRAIYPARALGEARDMLERRAAVGEEIRVVDDLPTRMFIIGNTHVCLPEPLGFVDEPRTLIRQRGVVQAMTLWFELLWDHATPVDELSGTDSRPDLRLFLLQQLASGAQDEQIARRLNVSLRTVRRRVADLLTELGADTRFQAGVEANRRGWI